MTERDRQTEAERERETKRQTDTDELTGSHRESGEERVSERERLNCSVQFSPFIGGVVGETRGTIQQRSSSSLFCRRPTRAQGALKDFELQTAV